jgi:streptogramin lyase
VKLNRPLLVFAPLSFVALSSLMTGCALNSTASPATIAGVPLKGTVFGGQQPVIGAKVYLLAANVSGYGGSGIAPSASNASVSLLTASGTGNAADNTGSYVLTNSSGGFSISNDFSCSAGTTQAGASVVLPGTEDVYLYALGGNPGGGTNSFVGLIASLGPCNALGPGTQVTMNEVTTVAAAFALSGFASDATHISSSGSALAVAGLNTAFNNINNLVSTASGTPLATTPAGDGTAHSATIYTLANILAACVNSAGASGVACPMLVNDASSQGSSGAVPTDTASAAINIAHNPGANVQALYQLIPSTGAPYMGGLTSQPNDFTLAINYADPSFNTPAQVAIDAAGSAWVTNYGANSVTELSSAGAVLSGANGYTGGGLSNPYGVAVDNAGNVWFSNIGNNAVAELSSTGNAISPSTGYTDASLSSPLTLAVDAHNDIWVANAGNNTLTELTTNGSVISTAGGYTGGGLSLPYDIAIDGSGNAWVANLGGSSVSKFSSAGAPISPSTGYVAGGESEPYSIAVDGSGDAWTVDLFTSNISELANNGSGVSSSNGYSGGGLDGPYSIAIDGAGSIWVTDANDNALTQLSNAGVPITGSNGYTAGGQLNFPRGLAIDGSGDIWIANSSGNSVVEVIGAATPVVTPIAAGLPLTPTANGSSSLGMRPGTGVAAPTQTAFQPGH